MHMSTDTLLSMENGLSIETAVHKCCAWFSGSPSTSRSMDSCFHTHTKNKKMPQGAQTLESMQVASKQFPSFEKHTHGTAWYTQSVFISPFRISNVRRLPSTLAAQIWCTFTHVGAGLDIKFWLHSTRVCSGIVSWSKRLAEACIQNCNVWW